jgi:hypothetical protein
MSSDERRAPVQGYAPGIPWSMHLRAYAGYCKRHGEQKALLDLEGRNCRGGFGVEELDEYIPGWREELSELQQAKRRITELEAQLAERTRERDVLQSLVIAENGVSLAEVIELRATLSSLRERLEPIRKMEQQATKAPWTQTKWIQYDERNADCGLFLPESGFWREAANFELIAALRNACPDLIQTLWPVGDTEEDR